MNTIEATKAFDRIFSNRNICSRDNFCIFIDGPWGIGKTHFIINYFSKNENEFIYTSVFGKNSVRDVEKSILIHSLPGSKYFNENSGVAKAAQKMFNDISDKFLGVSIDSYLNSFSIEDIKLNIISNKRKIICIDDIERKSDSVEIKNLLGLIERASKNFDVLIIGNTDELDENDIKILNRYKEKVVDYAIKIDKIDRNTLVFILKSMNIENRNEIIDVYLSDNITFGKALSGEKSFLTNKIYNIRIFMKYVELIMRLERYLEPYKADEDILKICKTVIYNHYFPDINEKKNSMNFDKFNIYKTINKILLNEDIEEDEFQEYFISNSEVREDIRFIYSAYRFNESEFKDIIKKIKDKIQSKDLEYFIKQENVISLVSALNEIKINKFGIKEEIINQLYKIAIDLYLPEKKLPKEIDYSQWNNYDYSGNVIECDENIKLFIKKINENSSEKYQNYIKNEIKKARNTKNYEQLLKLYTFNEINEIIEFEEIFDYYFNQLVLNYSNEISQKINTLISKTNSELIRDFFTNRIKNETEITKIKKYEQFDFELDRKMQCEAEQEYYTIDSDEETE